VERKPAHREGADVASLTAEERETLATILREIRARERLTQEQVAHNGDVGRKYVGQLERAELNPSFAMLAGVARGLGVRLSEIVRTYEDRLLDHGVSS